MSRDLLSDSGYMVIGDVSFQSRNDLRRARETLGSLWDDDEYYWAADEIIEKLGHIGINAEYEQVTNYSGIYKIGHCEK